MGLALSRVGGGGWTAGKYKLETDFCVTMVTLLHIRYVKQYSKVVNNISVVAPTLNLMHWCCRSVREEDWQYTWKYSHPASVTYLRAQRVRVTCHGGWQGGRRGQQGDRKDGGECGNERNGY